MDSNKTSERSVQIFFKSTFYMFLIGFIASSQCRCEKVFKDSTQSHGNTKYT